VSVVISQADAQNKTTPAQKSQKAQKAPKSATSAKKSSKGKKEKITQAPASAAISPALGKLKWGMSKDEVMQVLINQVRERYKPKLAKATDGIEEDRLTNLQNQEIKKIRDSYVRFDGQTSGWDLGFIKDEFTHNNAETMLVTKDSNSQNYYFFINDKLWKWYKALNIEVFEGKSFAQFADSVQSKFGKAKDVESEISPESGKRHWLEWQDSSSRLRAVDQTSFYGFYCLVFEDKQTLGNLASLRKNVSDKKGKTHAMIEAVTSNSNMTASPDESPDIVDRITGRNRTKEEAAAEPKPKGYNSLIVKPATSGSSSSSSSSSSTSDDSIGSTKKKNSNVNDDLEF